MEMAGLARSSDSIGETEMESLQFSGNKPWVSRLFLDAKGLLSAGLFSLAFSASSYTHISRRRSISGGKMIFAKHFSLPSTFLLGVWGIHFATKQGISVEKSKWKQENWKGKLDLGVEKSKRKQTRSRVASNPFPPGRWFWPSSLVASLMPQFQTWMKTLRGLILFCGLQSFFVLLLLVANWNDPRKVCVWLLIRVFRGGEWRSGKKALKGLERRQIRGFTCVPVYISIWPHQNFILTFEKPVMPRVNRQ